MGRLARQNLVHLLPIVARYATIGSTIKSFRSKGLKELWEADKGAAIRPDLRNRVQRLLDALHNAVALTDLSGFGTHPLKATIPVRYSMRVNGPWRITFEFKNGDAYLMDLKQYH